MTELDAVDLSRLQFAMTAMYHFIFVPLTLGLSFMLAIMESVYVLTREEIWKQMTQFWGILFGINFAMGVCTGVPLEFQFGTNWAYYSHYVGDVFGSILAVEGMMAFFLEATFLGLFYFGWKRLSPGKHLTVTWLLALGSNLSALWILVANAWMQNPVGASFNPETVRMELDSFWSVFFNPVAQSKFVHTVSAGYVTGAVFVLAVSSLYLLRDKHIAFAKRSMTVAASFGLAGALSAVVLGDESGYMLTDQQQMKIAAIEAMWDTKPAPAPFTIFALPDQETQTNHYELEVPWLMGLIATRSLDKQVAGVKELVDRAEKRIKHGLEVYRLVKQTEESEHADQAKKLILSRGEDLGHALLLKRYREDILQATPEEVRKAAEDIVPSVLPLFFAFRIMVGCGMFFILLFSFAFYLTSTGKFTQHRWFLRLSVASLPLPWIAGEMGWFVAEHGRQPWTIDGILPTFLSASQVDTSYVLATFIAFAVFYSALAVVDVFLMVKYVKMGPEKAVA